MIFKDIEACRYLPAVNDLKKRGGELQGRGIVSVVSKKTSINYSREKSCVCGKNCGLPGLPGSEIDNLCQDQ